MHMGTNRSPYRHSRAVFAVLSEYTHIFQNHLYKWYAPFRSIHDDAAYQIVEIVSRGRGGIVQILKALMGGKKRVTRSHFTIYPQWDTLTVGERVSHGEEWALTAQNKNMETS